MIKQKINLEFKNTKDEIKKIANIIKKNNINSGYYDKKENYFLISNFYRYDKKKNTKDFSDQKAKIIFSDHFRKLAYKTQVFFNNFGDYNRTRLIHSFEVSEISGSICRFIGFADNILSECISLCHDLGHAPFGHAGEDGINLALKELNLNSFNHNIQSIKIFLDLEKKYFNEINNFHFDKNILDGIIKHNGPINKEQKDISEKDFTFIDNICKKYDIEKNFASNLEGQIASISDDIAYTSHDIEDGFRANFISLKDLQNLPIIYEFINSEYKNKINIFLSKDEEKKILYNIIKYLTNYMILDCLKNFTQKIYENNINSCSQIQSLGLNIFDFSDNFKKDLKIIKDFLFKNFYKHPNLMTESIKMQKIIRDLFIFYYTNPECLNLEWQAKINQEILKNNTKDEIIIDFISGMTDRYALNMHKKIFDH
jgi:dGTPase